MTSTSRRVEHVYVLVQQEPVCLASFWARIVFLITGRHRMRIGEESIMRLALNLKEHQRNDKASR